MRTPKEDRELLINGYVYNENGTRAETISVYTSDYSYMAKFDKYCEEYPEHWKVKNVATCSGDVCGKNYVVSAGCLLIRPKPRRGRAISETEKEAMRARMREMRKAGIF